MSYEKHLSETTILIIDDQPANLSILVDYLEGKGVEVVIAENGESGLSRARFVQPDLILLDVIMPDMDGFEVCRQLKMDKVIDSIPVIFMTALSEVDEKVKGFSAGGVDYVTKPLQLDEIWARVTTHLTISQLHMQLEKQNRKLHEALAEIKTLQGILPLCTFCSKVRDDEGYWKKVEEYIEEHTEAAISHSICQDCFQIHYPKEFAEYIKSKNNIDQT